MCISDVWIQLPLCFNLAFLPLPRIQVPAKQMQRFTVQGNDSKWNVYATLNSGSIQTKLENCFSLYLYIIYIYTISIYILFIYPVPLFGVQFGAPDFYDLH